MTLKTLGAIAGIGIGSYLLLHLTVDSHLANMRSPRPTVPNSVTSEQHNTPAALSGRSVVGTEFTSYDDQGQRHILKIIDVELDPQDPEQEIYLYRVAYQDEQQHWQNLCAPSEDAIAHRHASTASHMTGSDVTASLPISNPQAIPLSGHWDETGSHIDDNSITFACVQGVLAKCVRWGYKPWKTVDGRSLRDYHQACTRMARADYCGQGQSHTREGTPIAVSDRLQIQRLSDSSRAPFSLELEAAWGPDGAILLHRTRWPEAMEQLQAECPEKLKVIYRPDLEQAVAVIGQNADAILTNHSMDCSVFPVSKMNFESHICLEESDL